MTYLPPVNGGRINAQIGGNTAGATASISTGTMTLAGGNNITLSQNGNAITISGGGGGAAGTNTLGMSNLGNSIGTSGVITGSNLQLALVGGNNVTLSQSINGSSATITVSAFNQSVQTQSLIAGVYDGANSISTGTIRFSNSNGVSFGINGQTLTASHNGITSQSNQTMSLYAVSNTIGGQNTTLNQDARTMSFAGAGIASVGMTNGSVMISVPSGGGGITNVNLSAGTTSNNLSKVTFADSNGVSWGLNGSTMTASVAAQSNQTLGMYAVGNTIGGHNTTLAPDARTVSLNALGAASVGYTNGSVEVSVPATSSLSATGIVSISTNASTISIGAPDRLAAVYDGANSISTGTIRFSNSNGVTFGINGQTLTASVPLNATISRYIYPNEYLPLNTSGATNNSISFNYVSLDQDVSASQFRALFSVSANTHTSASTNTYGLTAEVAVYTRNVSTITRASSGSQTWSGTYSTNSTASVQGIREVTIPMNVAMSPGEYWFGLRISSSSSNASVGYSGLQVSNQLTVHLNPARFGAASATSQLLYPWNGMYSVTSGALPASATLNDVLGSGTQGSRAMFWFDLRNYTVL